ncbi:hypothetical protein ACFVXE_15525 [Streptomyces sp. NPDC058231]|uniref:DUF7919 family protein n=1 Tax=Streptomyces sp. NPDC058231 TaxID=3346392 RepID=UPI0036ED57EF
MTYFADLTPYTYGHAAGQPEPGTPEGPAEINVGWLEPGQEYSAYDADDPPYALIDALKRLVATERVHQTRGFHLCPWCVDALLERSAGERARAACPRGSAEIRVLGDGVEYAAPELVAHYVEAHRYLPPAEFVAAVAGRRDVP